QLVMGSVSRLKDGGPSRPGTADILSAPGTADILSAPGTTDIFLVPTRCVGSWLLRAAERIKPVSAIPYTQEPNPPAPEGGKAPRSCPSGTAARIPPRKGKR
ncbi:hypothetical protein, partial [Candidatus Thiosymbion oneisti]|uniref:hypothetical protein n=1 Tax=Candidatus Thiosymbion oneisti TaxID=589554 RepID=UPI001C401E93